VSSITVLHPASITPEPTNSSRLKQSGMFWTVRGANAILALRCSLISTAASRAIGKAVARLWRLDIHF